MRKVQAGSRPHRTHARRAALVATALLLAGCETLVRHGEVVTRYAPATWAGGASLVIARVTVSPGAAAGQRMLAGAELAAFGAGRQGEPAGAETGPLSVPPTREAGAEGWANLTLPPGRHVLRLRAAYGLSDGGERSFAITVPATPRTLYIGTFRVTCAGVPAVGGCRIEPEPADETEAAAAMLAAHHPGAGAPLRALARPYPGRLDAAGLAPPGGVQIGVDTAAWMASIDWDAVAASMPRPDQAQPNAPRSERWPEEQPLLRPVSMNFSSSGSGAGIIFLPAAIVVALPIALVIHLAVQDHRQRSAEAGLRAAQEARRTMDAAQEQWGECARGIAATLSPASVEGHLHTALPPPRVAPAGPWRAAVRRVLLRQCGEPTANRHGVEVTTRWTAQRAGEAEPAFDAMFTRSVAGATPDPRLVHARRPPWELPVATEAACRPLADYCGAGGSALLLEDVVRGVTEARDAVAAAR
ncbi:carbohydrate-binding protein [Neoroseomonas soli]|uniref:Uncharacterized protein n=1 Tax=Neoroseomonas soli TaxID=1081025 RepID=A0A9X9X478_9PROT|nr:hypothetical protein [Neoroseomonas soli]MBR0674207.1 hypothetical protein [Neoroseomonas soli]